MAGPYGEAGDFCKENDAKKLIITHNFAVSNVKNRVKTINF
jgi:hypothetical protein